MPTTPSFTSQAIAIPPSHSLDVLDKIFQLIGYSGTIGIFSHCSNWAIKLQPPASYYLDTNETPFLHPAVETVMGLGFIVSHTFTYSMSHLSGVSNSWFCPCTMMLWRWSWSSTTNIYAQFIYFNPGVTAVHTIDVDIHIEIPHTRSIIHDW
jgi:hypothetical protein